MLIRSLIFRARRKGHPQSLPEPHAPGRLLLLGPRLPSPLPALNLFIPPPFPLWSELAALVIAQLLIEFGFCKCHWRHQDRVRHTTVAAVTAVAAAILRAAYPADQQDAAMPPPH